MKIYFPQGEMGGKQLLDCKEREVCKLKISLNAKTKKVKDLGVGKENLKSSGLQVGETVWKLLSCF